MKDVDVIAAVGGSFVCGMGFAVLFIVCISGTFKLAIDAIEQCEKSLPRDQKCIIVAVPENKHEKD
jgi:hypothetical protein